VITHQVLRDWDFELLALFHEIADRLYNPRLPTLQNTDGEPLSLHKLVFELNVPPQAIFDALKHLALDELGEDLLADATRDSEDKLTRVRFSWKKHGNKARRMGQHRARLDRDRRYTSHCRGQLGGARRRDTQEDRDGTR
jgi:hypothetical protein